MKSKLLLFALIVAILLAACASSSANLAGEWKLSEVNGKAPLAGTSITAKFENGKVGGNSGCNSYGGDFSASGSKLSFSAVMSTMMACADQGIMDQESAYQQALSQVTGYTVSADRMEMKNSAGETILVFTK
jgi:heat shock protein HslJ